MATAVKRQYEPQCILRDLLCAVINEKQARPIKHQLSIARLALAKDHLAAIARSCTDPAPAISFANSVVI
jgi:hypothetical protein